MAFTYRLTERENTAVLTMGGKLVDKAEATEVSADTEEALRKGFGRFIIDLSDLEYMNSTGLNILINVMNKTRNNGGDAVIVGTKPRILSLFSVTKLDTVFTMKSGVDEAFTHFEQTPKK